MGFLCQKFVTHDRDDHQLFDLIEPMVSKYDQSYNNSSGVVKICIGPNNDQNISPIDLIITKIAIPNLL